MRLCHVFALSIVLVLPAAAGCPNGGSSGGKSLNQQYSDALKISAADARARELVRIADQQFQAGDRSGAERSLRDAEEAAKSLSDPAGQAGALVTVAGGKARTGNAAGARRTLGEVGKMLEKIANFEQRVLVQSRMGSVYGRELGDKNAAQGELSQAEAGIARLQDVTGQILAVAAIAQSYHAAELADDAQRVIGTGLEIARAADRPRQRSDSITRLATAQARMNNTEAAAALFDEALATARSIPDDLSRAHALIEIATAHSQAGQKAKAAELFKEAEDVSEKIADQGLKREVLDKIQAGRAKL
jgi:tetratricopeptide (TPR) repeat protein